MNKWKTIAKELPNDGEVVFIRIISIYGPVNTATFNLSMQTFVFTNTFIVVPAYYVSRWKRM